MCVTVLPQKAVSRRGQPEKHRALTREPSVLPREPAPHTFPTHQRPHQSELCLWQKQNPLGTASTSLKSGEAWPWSSPPLLHRPPSPESETTVSR